jgi:hypothetical protein
LFASPSRTSGQTTRTFRPPWSAPTRSRPAPGPCARRLRSKGWHRGAMPGRFGSSALRSYRHARPSRSPQRAEDRQAVSRGSKTRRGDRGARNRPFAGIDSLSAYGSPATRPNLNRLVG